MQGISVQEWGGWMCVWVGRRRELFQRGGFHHGCWTWTMHVDRVCRLEIRWAWILREGKVQPPTCAFLEKDGTDFLLLLYFCSTCCRVPSTGMARHPNLHMNQNQSAPFSRNLGLLIPSLTSRHDQPPIQSHSMLFNTLSPPVVEPPCHSKHKLSEHNLRPSLHLPLTQRHPTPNSLR